MQKVYFLVLIGLCFCTITPLFSNAQDCSSLKAIAAGYESRCAATGSIKIVASGGSGSYKYKVTGPVNSNYTTSDSITGLSAGTYTITVNDIVNNCTVTRSSIVVPGTYQDPRFSLNGTDVSCENGQNASIVINTQQFGRAPFTYTIVAPSPMGIGTNNSSGVFTDLVAGNYSIRLSDSCGGIQTRSITLNDYTWTLNAYPFSKVSCDSAVGHIKVTDSRGNISTVNGIPGFSYGVVRQPGDTIWSESPVFNFNLSGANSFDLVARDACGRIKKGNTGVKFTSTVAANVSIINRTCSTFSASLSNLANFFDAQFCIYDSNNVQLACNNAGAFHNLSYGQYCITAHDDCSDTTINRCFSVNAPTLSVANTVTISDRGCNSFTASITGQTGLTDPLYCLLDETSTIVSCNTTGTFQNILYGNYCITVKDNCRDTVLARCISVSQPVPRLPLTILPAYTTCSRFGINVPGDSLYGAQYCLKDSSGSIIACNSTGVFDSLYFGNYCLQVYDSCYDTTITRCFNEGTITIVNDLATIISNKTCSTFTVKATTSTVADPEYCLYNGTDSLLNCNKTGIFNLVPNGSYCIKVHNVCPDTTLSKCFTVTAPLPALGSAIAIKNRTCADFSTEISGQKNLTDPEYCLYDSANVQMACNTTGIFNNIPYGRYCIEMKNSCYDTIITRCFESLPVPASVDVTSAKSCSYGYATLSIVLKSGTLPVNIKILRPDYSLLFNENYSSNNITLDSIPGLDPGLTYTVIATDNCGTSDSLKVGVTPSIATHYPQVFGQCPSALWQNGSGRIQLTTETNLGAFTVKVIKKNGVQLSPEIIPSTASGGVYTFNDLETGTYIISYKVSDLCNKFLYDTVTIDPYTYPNLNRSSAYQCDVSGFSIGAVANNGVGPFSYEIIGSTPALPSISTMPQANPIFNIDNGSNYSLIRLRALDACGNATLADASILPLAGYQIIVDSNCFQSSSTLSVDTIYNSTYSWYKKENRSSTDSTFLSHGYSIHIPFLSAGDTGIYVCHVMVNTGCVNRSYEFNLTGLCYQVLPITIKDFRGRFVKEQAHLRWNASQEIQLQAYVIERRTDGSGFVEIGRVLPGNPGLGNSTYDFIDPHPMKGDNQYRLRLISNTVQNNYSSTILLKQDIKQSMIRAYPNPVSAMLTITFEGAERHMYQVQLLNIANQVLVENMVNTELTRKVFIPRAAVPAKGLYILKCIDLLTNEMFSQKIFFD